MMIRELQKHFPARIPEWANAWCLLGWGAYTILHPGVFQQPYLQGLVDAAGAVTTFEAERFWGLVTVVVGMTRLCALFVNGSYSRTPMIRLIASLVSAFVWTQIILGIWVTDVPAHGLVMYTTALVLDLISAYRAACDTAIAEATRRSNRLGSSERGDLQRAIG